MNDTKKAPSNFGLGLIIGTVLGGLAAFFLSPNSGKENREEAMARLHEFKDMLDEADIPTHVKEVYGDVTKEGTKMYSEVRKELIARMDEMKDKVDDFDADKYIGMIEDTVEEVRRETDDTVERASKLKKYLVDKWMKAEKDTSAKKRQVKKQVKEIAKKTRAK